MTSHTAHHRPAKHHMRQTLRPFRTSPVDVTEVWLESLQRHTQTGVRRKVHWTKTCFLLGTVDESLDLYVVLSVCVRLCVFMFDFTGFCM